ncbi:MAG: exported protein of unknown function [Candidatus Saccharibacteria bacterium]|nr:exported protein of unknown function [Candidatus Saccharibacteria bacterium]
MRQAGVWCGLFVVLCLLLATTPQAAAQSSGELNLTTSPLPINLEVKPGNTISTDLRVQNSGNQTETLKIDLQKFKAYGEDGKPQLIAREPGDDYFDWAHFSQTTFTAEPNVWTTIKMTIAVPKTAAFGYYYAVVFSRAHNTVASQPRANSIVGGTATLVLLDAQVPGAKKQVDVMAFISDKKLYEYLPAQFTIRLRNAGVVHVAPSGTLFILRGKKQVDLININPEKGNILPGSNRIFRIGWDNGFPRYVASSSNGQVIKDKNGQDVQNLKWDFSQASHLRIGRYTAKLLLTYDNGSRDVPIQASVSFWVLPWKLLAGFLVFLGLCGAGLWFIARSLLRKLKAPKSPR